MPTKLGQNFLKDASVVKKIIDSANITPDDFILEIGPGEGILTEALADRSGKIIAIEIDKYLAGLLKNKFKNKKNITIINEDILKVNLGQVISNSQFPIFNKVPNFKFQTPNYSYKVIANLPYYITSPIIRLFLESDFPPKEMILMVQKEVAERIVEKPGRMSILSISVQYYAQPELLFYVSKNSFHPVPEVDSAIIKIVPFLSSPAGGEGWSEEKERERESRKKFFRIVRAGFSAKRKTLLNNLSSSFHLDKKEVEKKLKKVPLSGTIRAQELSIEDWKKIADLF